MRASIIREILKIAARPDVISFAGGLPAPATFPLKEFEIASKDALKQDGTKALQYTVTEGHLGLKQYLCDWMAKDHMKVTPSEMLLTHGSQQALDFLGKIFLNPGDQVLLEDPSYLGAIQSFNQYEPRYIPVPIDQEGLIPAALEKALNSNKKIKFIYTVPTFQNPSGVTMSLERRRFLLKIAKEKNIPIIEDDPYSRLRFRGESLPTLYSLSKGQGVIFLSTLSKLLSPGIRLGFVAAKKDLIQQLVYAKQASDLQNNTFIQYAVYHYMKRGFFEKHIPFITKDYAKRAAVMMAAIKAHFPPEVKVFEPMGGMFVWCELPKGATSAVLFKAAIRRRVAFVDGSFFYANGGGENTLRLNFTNSTLKDIDIGIKRLSSAISDILR